MSQPGPAQDLAVAQVQAIIENAQKLGLVWVLRPATVVGDSPILATQDGDTEPIAHTSLIGSVFADQRVWVLVVPPSGNYIVGFVDTGWLTPTLLNSWSNFGSGFQAARYRRVGTGQVEIQGLVTGGTGPVSTVFTLPAGFRPAATLIFATIANNAVARIDVEADGDVRWALGGTNAFLSLNCTFHMGT